MVSRLYSKVFYRPKGTVVIELDEQDVTTTTQRIAKEKGVFANMSSVGSVFRALKVAETIDKGVVVTTICDLDGWYLSSALIE